MTGRYDGENDRDADGLDADRYAAFTDGAGDVVVYDTTNDAAWLKSDAAVELEAMA